MPTPHKGSRYVIKLGTLPPLIPERKSAPATLINFKDNKKYINAPPPAVGPVEVAPADEDIEITMEEFYGTLDQEKLALSQKQLNALSNPELRSAEKAKMSRKFAKGLKFINFVSDTIDTLDATEEKGMEGLTEQKVELVNPRHGLEGAEDRESEGVKKSDGTAIGQEDQCGRAAE
ncbi:unnamed protein product [Urochloa humidicola]